MDEPTCVLIDNGRACGRPVYVLKRGWCKMHYRRWERHGDPLKRLKGGDGRWRVESLVDRSGGPDACHPWQGKPSRKGYGMVMVAGANKSAHAAVWEFENGPRPPGMDLDHECHNRAVREGTCRPGKCDHRLCCNLKHLILRTKDEHREATVPWDRGSWYRCRAKLTDDQVREIRGHLADGELTRAELAERYGVGKRAIYMIATGKAWGWLDAA